MTKPGWRNWVEASLREWSWRHTAMGLAVGSLALFNMGGLLFIDAGFPFLRSWIYNVFEFGLPFVLAVRVADRAVADGRPAWLAYSLAIVGVIATGVWMIGPLLFPLLGGDPDWQSGDDWKLAMSQLLPFSVATVAYAHWRQAQDTLARVQRAELARVRQEQLVQSARLLALQARVEPQFLFDALKRVRELLDGTTDAAERRLGDLISLLRAMQPAAGATASTVAREVALVRAYGHAGEAPALLEPRLTAQMDDDAGRARLAPLVLLPALRRLAGDAPGVQWQLGALRTGDRLRLAIAPQPPSAVAVQALASLDTAVLQQRLAAVHGAQARLAVRLTDPPALHIETDYQADADALPSPADDPSPDR
jgi:Histidine kinase